MKRSGLMLLTMASLAACGGGTKAGPQQAAAALPSSPLSGSASVADAGCGLHVGRPWTDPADPARRYSIEADTEGAVCDIAVVTLTIKSSEGASLLSWQGQTRDMVGLRDAADPKAMAKALGDWLDQSGSAFPDTGALPTWEDTVDQSDADTAPFHPAAGFDKAAWETLRAKKLGVFCFAQGSESKKCVALNGGKLEDLGLQQLAI